jgi:hypothetical protein
MAELETIGTAEMLERVRRLQRLHLEPGAEAETMGAAVSSLKQPTMLR